LAKKSKGDASQQRDARVDQLAREAGLPSSLARLVLETARDVIEVEYPHLAGRVEALFADEARGRRAIRWIAKLGASARPQGDALDVRIDG
jgi:hypothetical protein